MSPPGPSPQAGRWSVRAALAAAVFLALLIAAVHGPALRLGLFMDDHAHFRQLRECDWSLAGLTAACRLELVGGVIRLWWLPECTLRFFRPAAFGLMKLGYTLSGWEPVGMHAASLLWHLLNCILLTLLLRCCGASAWLATATAGLFAIHPAHVATVQWIACQSELMVTAFLLAATLCLGRFRGWAGFGPASENGPVAASLSWALAGVAFFALALGCRENAVAFPLVLAAGELGGVRRRPRGRLWPYVALALLVTAYAALRSYALRGAAVPPRPYVIPPGDPDFARFVFDKAWYYLLGEFFLIPCVPIAGLPYFQARPRLFYVLAAVVGALLLAVCLRYRCRPPGLLGPAWLIGFILPVLPVFASPHHLYLPGIGWAATFMLLLRGLGTAGATAVRWVGWVRKAILWLLVFTLLVLFARLTTWLGLAFETGTRIEECLVEEIAAAPSGLHDGDTLYVANLPLIGHYVRLAVEERTGRRDLRVIPLTWAPRILGQVTPAELTWIDDRAIEMRVAGDRYFSGPLAQLIQEATGGRLPDAVDRTADYGFRVEVLERGDDGVTALRFTFDRPLSAPGIHLFWGSRTRWACEVRPPGRD